MHFCCHPINVCGLFRIPTKHTTVLSSKESNSSKQLFYKFTIGELFDNIANPWMNQEAQDALKYYKGYEGKTDGEITAFTKEFDRLQSISTEQQKDHSLRISDFSEFFK